MIKNVWQTAFYNVHKVRPNSTTLKIDWFVRESGDFVHVSNEKPYLHLTIAEITRRPK